MDPLKPIPIPLSVKWRDFRERRLPLLVFCVVCCFAFVVWQKVGTTPTLAGIGEGCRSLVMSPQTGWVSKVLVEPFQVIKKGDPIAIIRPVDPGADMDLMRLEMEIARMRQEPTVPEQNAVGYERARLEYFRLRSELAVARAKWMHAEKELQRNQPLVHENLVSRQAHELLLRERDVYKAEVEDKTKIAAETEIRLNKIRPMADPFLPAPDSAIRSLADRWEGERENIRSNWVETVLRAPIDGMTGPLNRQLDEFVFEGEIIATINSLQSDRIVGYLRQPYTVDPQPGMKVSVATRTKKRSLFTSQILQTGAQCEYITNALALLRPYSPADIGLPIVVEIPEGIRIRPGEQVDLILHPMERVEP